MACANSAIAVWQHEIHSLAKEKGWWSVNPKDRPIPEQIANFHGEISEAFEEYRRGVPPQDVYYEGDKPCGFAVELADAVIRIMDTCEAYGIDLGEMIRIKHEYNKTRPFRHGDKLA